MPLSGADFVPRSEEDILNFLESELRREYGEDIDLTQSSAFRAFATALARHNANEVQSALEDVHQAAFLDTAEGGNLDRLANDYSVTRRAASHATGVVEFQHGDTADQTYTIRNGTTVQTGGSDSVQFETTELVTLALFADFDDGSLPGTFQGDTGSFTVEDASNAPGGAYDGSSSMLTGSGSGNLVYDTTENVARGSKMRFAVAAGNTTGLRVAGNCFAVDDSGNSYYRIRLDLTGGTHAIEHVDSGTSNTFQSESVAIPTDAWVENEVEWTSEDGGTITSRVYDDSGTLISELEVTDEDTLDEGGFGFESLDSDAVHWDHSGEYAVHADARAIEGGPSGNVASNTVTDMPVIPSGVAAVTNPWPMGDTEYLQTDLTQFSTGIPEESDEELRERVQQSRGAGGDATVPALLARLRQLPQAVSVSVYENKENTDNTGSGGLPPKSFEVVYYGNDPDDAVASAIFDEKAFTARDYAGAHGTEVTHTVTAENGQTFTLRWSNPTEVSVSMDFSIVVNDEFIGESELRSRIAEYVGGLRPDGSEAIGLGEGEDVYVDQIEDIVVGPDDTGVIGISSQSYTPSTTTDSNGLEIVQIGSGETAHVDTRDLLSDVTFDVTRV